MRLKLQQDIFSPFLNAIYSGGKNIILKKGGGENIFFWKIYAPVIFLELWHESQIRFNKKMMIRAVAP